MNKTNKEAKTDLTAIKRSRLSRKGDLIRVGMSTCGIAAGADKVFAVLKEEVAKRNLDIKVERCGCVGQCYAEPLVEVAAAGLPKVTYGQINEKDAVAIIERHVCNKKLLQDRIYQIS